MTVSDTESVADEAVSEDSRSNGRTAAEREPFGRFRRGIDRLRGDADTHANGNSVDDDRDLKLEVMLLRAGNRDGDCRSERAIPHLADSPATLDSAS